MGVLVDELSLILELNASSSLSDGVWVRNLLKSSDWETSSGQLKMPCKNNNHYTCSLIGS